MTREAAKTYTFLTAEMTLPPGIIAFLYKCRWDIEKVFDQNKNKLSENKAWANSATAKKQQAHPTLITIHSLASYLVD
jgi:IS4 transposase